MVAGLSTPVSSNSDPGNSAVMRVDADTGAVETYSIGTPSDPMRLPNALAFDDVGNLYVTDSGEYLEDDGVVYRIDASGRTTVWARSAGRYPNGICLDAAGSEVYVAESYFPGVVAIGWGSPCQVSPSQ